MQQQAAGKSKGLKKYNIKNKAMPFNNRRRNRKFEKAVMAMSPKERSTFLYKFIHVFILHEGKENKEDLVREALSRIKP